MLLACCEKELPFGCGNSRVSRSLKIGGGDGEEEEAMGEMISTTGAGRGSAIVGTV